MSAPSPISTPAWVIWREFRHRVVPTLVFGAAVAAVALLWSRGNTAPTLSGIGEGVRSVVTSPQPGLLRELKVHPYQNVKKGDPVAVIQPTDPQISMDLLQAELDVARLRLQPSVAEQNAMNYEQVRTDLLRTKSELAVAKKHLERAQNEVRRNTPLYHEKLVSEDIYDLSVKTSEAFQAEVTEKTEAVRLMEERLQKLQSLGDPQAATTNRLQSILEHIGNAQMVSASNSGPITLVAPISGTVSVINRQPGEHVVEGEPIVSVYSLWSERIVGYLRQPYQVDPEIGMPVQVITRTQKRRQFWTSISQIGAQIEIITNALAFVRQGMLVDAGLPIILNLPVGSQIRPGEIVDLQIELKQPSSLGELARPTLITETPPSATSKPTGP